MLTATLTVGAVTTPLSGRLADGRYRKATSFPIMVAGRASQGIGVAITPMMISAAREFLPDDRLRQGVRLLVVSTSIGTGLGYPITGIIADRIDDRAAYWLGALVAVTALA